MIILFLKGAVLGLALAAPVGPINLLCMKRSLEQGQKIGLITGTGAAVADTFYGAVAAFGLTFISDWLQKYKAELSLLGGVFFLIIGVSLIIKKNAAHTESKDDSAKSAGSAFVSSLFLTLSNPTTVFSFLAAFAAIKLQTRSNAGEIRAVNALIATLGVFCGSMSWWTFLSWITARFRKALDAKAIRKINFGAGLALVIFGLVVFGRGVETLRETPRPSSSESSTH